MGRKKNRVWDKLLPQSYITFKWSNHYELEFPNLIVYKNSVNIIKRQVWGGSHLFLQSTSVGVPMNLYFYYNPWWFTCIAIFKNHCDTIFISNIKHVHIFDPEDICKVSSCKAYKRMILDSVPSIILLNPAKYYAPSIVPLNS